MKKIIVLMLVILYAQGSLWTAEGGYIDAVQLLFECQVRGLGFRLVRSITGG